MVYIRLGTLVVVYLTVQLYLSCNLPCVSPASLPFFGFWTLFWLLGHFAQLVE